MKFLTRFIALLLALPLMALTAQAKVEVNIDLSTQRMQVNVDGRHFATWPISSGRKEYYTPRGAWRPKFLKRMHYSSKYDNAPMPYSIFYHGGIAIHGTTAVSRLGSPASHGCVRLSTPNAAKLFSLVQKHGRKNTIIRVTGSTDAAYARLREQRQRHLAAQRKARRVAAARRKARAAQRSKARRVAARRATAQRRARVRKVRTAQRNKVRRYRPQRSNRQRQRAPRYDFLQVYGATFLR